MNRLAEKARLGAATVQDPRWTDVVARNAEADGKFYFGVKTTGVYCRPSCGARTARPENVSFYATREEAQSAGFRPCKRCQPDRSSVIDQHISRVTQACRIIEESETTLSLEELARQLGMSVHHFHRVFKQITGLTPRQYATAQRGEKGAPSPWPGEHRYGVFSTPAIVPAAVFMKDRTKCWVCCRVAIGRAESMPKFVLLLATARWDQFWLLKANEVLARFFSAAILIN